MFDWVRLRPRAAPVALAAWRSPQDEWSQAAVPGSKAVTRRNVPMKWTQLLAGLVAVLSATECLAETPNMAADQTTAMAVTLRNRLITGQDWWSRYGEPVNATALAQVSPSDKGAMGAPIPLYGDGYIFAPGSCDCPPPCIWQLWAGYYQNPHRCNPDGHLFHRHCGCCGAHGGGGCGCCGKGCSSCTKTACGCSAPVSCTTAATGCGCKPVCGKCRTCHLGWHGCGAHWNKTCSSCSAPLSCGCTTAVPPLWGSEKQAGKVPSTLPDEAALYTLPRLN
jgi:hypothetical protein